MYRMAGCQRLYRMSLRLGVAKGSSKLTLVIHQTKKVSKKERNKKEGEKQRKEKISLLSKWIEVMR